MNKKKSTIKRGFTIVELIVSIFIFLAIMTGIVTIFASQIRAYRHVRVAQNDLENAQFAMNYLAKTLRTATVLGENTTDLRDAVQFQSSDFELREIAADNKLVIYDFSQELCMRFSFVENGMSVGGSIVYTDSALWVESVEGVLFDRIEDCLNNETYTMNATYKRERLTTGDVTGTFWVAPTRYQDHLGSSQTDTIGRVTIGMSVLPPSSNKMHDTTDPIYIQTSTSLRDYPPDLSF